MQRNKNYLILLLFLLIPGFIWSCGEDKEPPQQSQVVSKKITVKDQPQPEKKQDTPAVKDRSENAETEVTAAPTNAATRIYHPKERTNPFTPLFRAEKKDTSIAPSTKGKKKKRLPQTPLERIGLDQLKLVATIRAPSGNRALVEDSSGKGYIIKNGTYIGLNSGIVTQINAASVIVEEEIENFLGEQILQNTEIKLQKPAGE